MILSENLKPGWDGVLMMGGRRGKEREISEGTFGGEPLENYRVAAGGLTISRIGPTFLVFDWSEFPAHDVFDADCDGSSCLAVLDFLCG